MDIHERLKAIIGNLGLNNNSFARLIGVTSTTIDSITTGRLQPDGSRKRTKPGFDLLKKIMSKCNINPDYLFENSDDMFVSEIAAGLSMPKVITVNEDGDENVTFIGVQARAGYLNGYGDPEYMENQPSFSMPMLNNGTFRCFEIKGNSMLPTLHDGDMVFGKYVDDFDDIVDGRVHVIVSKNEGVVVKRVINRIKDSGKLILKSDNKDGNYPMFSINAEDVVEVWYASMYASRQMPDPISIFDQLHDVESRLFELEELYKNVISNAVKKVR